MGFLVGAAAGAVGSAAAQFIRNGNSFQGFSVQDMGANAAGGAVSGFLSGITLGASNVGIGTAALVCGTTNLVGGGLSRAVDSPEANTDVLDPKQAAWDAGGGALGGAIGKTVGDAVRAPVANMKRTAEGMARNNSSYGAVHGRKGVERAIERKETRAGNWSTVLGAKVENALLPVLQELREQD